MSEYGRSVTGRCYACGSDEEGIHHINNSISFFSESHFIEDIEERKVILRTFFTIKDVIIPNNATPRLKAILEFINKYRRASRVEVMKEGFIIEKN